MDGSPYRFQLKQGGMVVATVEGPDAAQTLKEIMHYALMYAGDGEVTIEGVTAEDWKILNSSDGE